MKPEWARVRTDPHLLDLSDDTAVVVQAYIRWRYTGDVFVDEHLDDYVGLQALVDAYVFGYKIIDTTYRNAVMDLLCQNYCSSPFNLKVPIIDSVFTRTPKGSPLRQFCADILAYGVVSAPKIWVDHVHPKMLKLLTLTLLEVRPVPDKHGLWSPWSTDLDPYSECVSEEEC
jgi:hypothetical protein